MGQEDFSGIATATALIGTLAGSSGAGTVVSLQNATGWPTGATGIPFAGTFGRGSATEEKILFSSRSGNNLTIAQRGYDDSVAVTHQNGEPVVHTVDATVLRTSSAHVFDTARDDHTQYARTDMSRVLTGSVKATNASHYFGAGANGAAVGFTQVGNSGGTALVSAGHGTLADASLVLRAKGTGNVELKSGSDVARAGSIGENAFLGVEIAAPAGAVGCVVLGSATGIPSANPVGGGVLYVDAGALKYRGPSGTITTLGPA